MIASYLSPVFEAVLRSSLSGSLLIVIALLLRVALQRWFLPADLTAITGLALVCFTLAAPAKESSESREHAEKKESAESREGGEHDREGGERRER